MKKLFTILILCASLLFVKSSAHAQDSTNPGAVKQINKTSEKSDKEFGKKIQQESLTKSFEVVDTTTLHKSKKVKKSCRRKCRHKDQ